MECRERAMGEYRRRRERGMGREEAREMWRNGRRMVKLDPGDVVQVKPDGEMEIHKAEGKGLGHALGEKGAGSGGGDAGGGGAGAGDEVSGYTHEVHEKIDGLEITFDEPRVVYGTQPGEGPSDEELLAFAEGYRDKDDGGTYMLGIVIVAVITAVMFFCLGLGIGSVVYGI